MMSRFLRHSAMLVLVVLCGCSPVTRHKVLSTIFDGVPTLPPADEYCQDYANRAVADSRAEIDGKGKAADVAPKQTTHKPYEEKLCDSCHNKSADSGFVTKSKTDLCFVCHINFIKGSFVHGPAAAGDCLACHDPHTATNPFLLKASAGAICAKWQLEARLAVSLHQTTAARGITCVDCHDPHAGNARFFLK
jgi:predicted CXXCH cytochrome family protein